MNKLLLGLLCSVSIQIQAQSVTAVLSSQSKYLKAINYLGGEQQIGFPDGNNVIQIEATTGKQPVVGYRSMEGHAIHGLVIRKVDADGNEIKVNKIENGERVFGPMSTDAIEFQGKLLLFYFKFIDKSKLDLYLSEIDRNTLALNNTKTLYSFPLANWKSLFISQYAQKTVLLKMTPDSSRLCIAATGAKDDLFLSVLDRDLNTQFSKTIPVPGTATSQLSNLCISNSGLMGAIYSKYIYSTLSSAGQWAANKAVIINADKKEKQIDLEAESADGELQHPTMLITRDESKIYLAGDYNGPVRKAGIWYKEIAATTLKDTKTQRIAYPPEYLEEVEALGFGDKRKGQIGLDGVPYQLVELPDGKLLLGGSPKAMYDSRNNSGKGHLLFFTGPVMMTILDGSKKARFTQIPRNNNFGEGAQPIFAPYKNKIIVIYNDYEKNIVSPITPSQVKQRSGAVTRELSLAYAVVTSEGIIETRQLLAPGIARMNAYNTEDARWISNTQLLIPAGGGEKKESQLKVAAITIQ